MRAIVLADTHVRDEDATRLPQQVWEALHTADLILHAGDVVGRRLLDELRAIALLHAVLGNNDTGLDDVLPETLELETGGVRLAMVHDSGPRAGRENRLHRRFPTADVVIFGHSHIPWNAPGVAGQLLFNPGSPTQRRRQPHRTFGVLDLDDGKLRAEVVEARGDGATRGTDTRPDLSLDARPHRRRPRPPSRFARARRWCRRRPPGRPLP